MSDEILVELGSISDDTKGTPGSLDECIGSLTQYPSSGS